MTQLTTPTRNELLAQIHVAARDLGLETRKGHDRTAYETLLTFLVGRDSCLDATREQLEFLADTLTRRAAGCKLEAIVFTPVPTQRIVVMSREQFERESDELERMLAGF